MIFLFLIAAVVLLDLGLKDTIDEMDQEQFPKELEGSRGWILLTGTITKDSLLGH